MRRLVNSMKLDVYKPVEFLMMWRGGAIDYKSIHAYRIPTGLSHGYCSL
jgi:hypothetical protein